MKTSFLAAGAALLALTACGGGGGAGFGVDHPISGSTLESEYDRLIALNGAPSGSTPTIDSVSYVGVSLISPDLSSPSTGYIGSVNITANFGTNDNLTGTIDNFYLTNISGGAPSGVIRGVNGSLTLLGSTTDNLDISVSGSINPGGSGEITFAPTAELSGAFQGSDREILFTQNLNVPVTAGGDALGQVDVRMVAQEQP